MLTQDEIDAQIARAKADILSARNAAFDSMPHGLRAFPAWGFYTAKKLPVRLHEGIARWAPYVRDPLSLMHVNDPSTWATFAACRASPLNPSLLGPAFVLSQGWSLIAIDMDDPIRSLQHDERFLRYNDEGRKRVLARANGCNAEIIRIAREYGLYVELSMSGRGAHILAFGQLEHATYSITYGGNIFTRSRFFAMTGNVLRGAATDVTIGQAGVDAIVRMLNHRGALEHAEHATGHVADADQTLSDDDVVAALPRINDRSAEAYSGRHDGDWSRATRNLVGDLAKISKNNAQVERIARNSPLVRLEPNNLKSNESRAHKFERLFPTWLADARPSNEREFERRRIVAAENLARFGSIKAPCGGS